MATATKTKAKARAGATADVPRIDGRLRFNWLAEYHATIAYEGGDCVVIANRKTFRAPTLAGAVNLGIAAMPMKSGK
jgi:hypothetical protein